MLKILKSFNKKAALMIPLVIGGFTACIDSTEQVPSGALFFLNTAFNLPKAQLRINENRGVFREDLVPGGICCWDIYQNPTLLVRALDTTYTLAIYNNDSDTVSRAVSEVKINVEEAYFYLLSPSVTDSTLIMKRYKREEASVPGYIKMRFVNSAFITSGMGGVDIYFTSDTTDTLSDVPTPMISGLTYLDAASEKEYEVLTTPDKAFKIFITPAGERNGAIISQIYRTAGQYDVVFPPGAVRTIFIYNSFSSTTGEDAFPLKKREVGL